MSDITPGDYTLIAKATVPATGGGAPSIVYAATTLNVQGEPTGSLSLILEPAMTLSGRLRFDGSLPVPDPKAIRITLQPGAEQGATLVPAPAVVNADGSFTMSGVTPGAYRFTVLVPGAGRAESWHVRSATLNGRNALDLPVTISSSQILSDAVIEFTDQVASLSGALGTSSGGPAPGYTVILFPTDQTLWLPRSRRINVSRPGPDGSFHFDAFPGGEYYLAAVDDVEPGEWFDPSFLQTLVANATKITIAEGEKKVQDLRVPEDK